MTGCASTSTRCSPGSTPPASSAGFRTIHVRDRDYGGGVPETSPTSRALSALEAIQASPGINAERLGTRLGRERARREAVRRDPARGRDPDRVRARSLRRLPGRPWAAAAAADVHRHRGDGPGDGRPRGARHRRRRRPGRRAPSGRWSGSSRSTVAGPLEALREVAARRTDPDPPDPETTATLVGASVDRRRCRIDYAPTPARRHAHRGRPVGGRGPVRPLVRPGLVARRRGPADVPRRPGPLGRRPRRDVHPARGPRPLRRARGADVPGLGARRGRRHRRAPRGGRRSGCRGASGRPHRPTTAGPG